MLQANTISHSFRKVCFWIFATVLIFSACHNNNSIKRFDNKGDSLFKNKIDRVSDTIKRSKVTSGLKDIDTNTNEIHLYFDTINPGFLSRFQYLPKLKLIKFTNCKFNSINIIIIEIAKKCDLSQLIIEECNLKEVPDNINGLRHLEDLQIIEFSFKHYALNSNLFKMTTLKNLRITGAIIGKNEISKICNLKNLKFLELSTCGMEMIDRCLLVHSNIEKLVLSNNKINKIDCKDLYNPNLKVIDIADNPYGNRIIRHYEDYFFSKEKDEFKKHFPNCELVFFEEIEAQ